MKIDNFALTMHQTCPAKHDLRINRGYTSRYKAAPLVAGGAIHEGLAEWYRTGDQDLALMAVERDWPLNTPPNDWRTLTKCQKTVKEYITRYPTENFVFVGAPEQPLIEVTFTLDTGRHTAGGDPIQYGGIFDGLVEQGDHVYVFEHKTASRMGDSYFDQFKPNNQITGYIWAAGLLSGRKVGGALINAIGFYEKGATRFRRDFSSRSEEDIESWLDDIETTCNEIETHKRTGHWPKRTESCINKYGRCEYHSVHSLSYSDDQQRLLDQDYIVDPWDYEHRDAKPEGEPAHASE